MLKLVDEVWIFLFLSPNLSIIHSSIRKAVAPQLLIGKVRAVIVWPFAIHGDHLLNAAGRGRFLLVLLSIFRVEFLNVDWDCHQTLQLLLLPYMVVIDDCHSAKIHQRHVVGKQKTLMLLFNVAF